MAKKQTRRSVSLRAEQFVLAQRVAAKLGMSVSAAIEEAIQVVAQNMVIESIPRGEALALLDEAKAAKAKAAAPLNPDDILSAHFTF